MAKPTATAIQDACQCGAVLRIESPDAFRACLQHNEWLEAHEPCQEWHDHWWERLAAWARAKAGGEHGA